jgi:hypothetical protein
MRAASSSVWRKLPCGVVRSRRIETEPPQQDMVDHRDAFGHAHRGGERTRLAAVSAPRRNVELKATDPDPDRSLAVCLDLGAEDTA